MTRIPSARLFAGAAVVVLAALVLNWLVPSGWYLFSPNPAKPLAGHVEVEGGRDADGTPIYYVDVTVRQASWLERLAGIFRPDGSTLIAEQDLLPEGTTFEHRRLAAAQEMKRSQEVAAAVALEAAGRDVNATPSGAIVVAIGSDVPAARVLREGDVIVSAAGRRVRTPGDLREATASLRPGDELAVTLRRQGRRLRVVSRTVPSRGDDERAVLGIFVAQNARIDLPLEVKIDLGQVGGPSAGLPFALQILEELGRDVDHGRVIAATGELELDGSVSPIGGVKQKVIGAREAGVDVFVVPAGENADEARRYGKGLRIVGVETFQQALRKLDTLAKKG